VGGGERFDSLTQVQLAVKASVMDALLKQGRVINTCQSVCRLYRILCSKHTVYNIVKVVSAEIMVKRISACMQGTGMEKKALYLVLCS
jgi:hypothetical protein